MRQQQEFVDRHNTSAVVEHNGRAIIEHNGRTGGEHHGGANEYIGARGHRRQHPKIRSVRYGHWAKGDG